MVVRSLRRALDLNPATDLVAFVVRRRFRPAISTGAFAVFLVAL
jgi:hypothetical protein